MHISVLLIKLGCCLQRTSRPERDPSAAVFLQPSFYRVQQLGGYSSSFVLRQHGHSAQVSFSVLAYRSRDRSHNGSLANCDQNVHMPHARLKHLKVNNGVGKGIACVLVAVRSERHLQAVQD
jgi:hypothetical protein